MKVCPPNKILNPVTNKCVLKTGAIGKKILMKQKTPTPKPKTPTPKPKTPANIPKLGIPEKKIVERLYGTPNKNKLSDLIKTTFKLFPFNHGLSTNQINKFIKAADPSVREIAKKIFDNTVHVSFESFLARLNSNIYHLISISDVNRPIFVYMDKVYNYETKSNYWLYLYVKGFVSYITNDKKEVNIITNFNNSELKKGDKIVLIDDCIYSGTQMSETISDIYIYNKESYDFYLLVSYISIPGLYRVLDFFYLNENLNNSSITNAKYQYLLKSTNSILTEKEMDLMNRFYYVKNLFNNKYMIYFDHKLADIVSTLTDFYLGIVPNKKNLATIINDYKYNKSIQNRYSDNIQVIPVIKNCKHYTKNLDIMSPKCPAPPYKPSFKDFIKIMKNKN